MRILITGASGFVGAPLSLFFSQLGHEVVSLTRSCKPSSSCIPWNPDMNEALSSHFEGFDAVIHLAGESLSIRRWSAAKKEKILSSRVLGTKFLCDILSSVKKKPRVFISASAVGFYGNRGEEILDESSGPGVSFLSSVCLEWEKASLGLASHGIRVVHTRFGAVIGPNGGILQRLLPLYRFGLGARLGSGAQWMSWIALEDLLHAMDFVLRKDIQGVMNFVSPYPVRQKDLSSEFASCLHAKAFLWIPAAVLRCLLGQAADEMLLCSIRVNPKRLCELGFVFKYPLLIDALHYALST